MGNRRVLSDPMPQVKNMWAIGEGRANAVDCIVQRRPARQKQQRIEVALHRHIHRQRFVCPYRIDGFIQPRRRYSGFPHIGRKLFPRPLRKADNRQIGIACLQTAYDFCIGGNHPAFELIGRQRSRPAVE